MSIVSRATADEELKAGRLVELALPDPPGRRVFHLIDHPHKHHGAACQAMIGLLSDRLGEPRGERPGLRSAKGARHGD